MTQIKAIKTLNGLAHNSVSVVWVTLGLLVTEFPHANLKQRHVQSHQGPAREAGHREDWRESVHFGLNVAMVSVDLLKLGGLQTASLLPAQAFRREEGPSFKLANSV